MKKKKKIEQDKNKKKFNFPLKPFIIVLILLLGVGYATLSVSLNITGTVYGSFNFDDASIYIGNLYNNDINKYNSISVDKTSFNILLNTGDNNIDYYIVNNSTEYDEEFNISCEQLDNVTISQDSSNLYTVSSQLVQKNSFTASNNTGDMISLTCLLSNNEVSTSSVTNRVKKVFFNSDGVKNSTPYLFISDSTFGTLPDITVSNSNYTFDGWFDSNDNKIVNTSTVDNLTDMVLTAKISCSSCIDLYSTITNLYVGDSVNSTLDFSVNSASDGSNGVYKTINTDSGDAVYYYRGNYATDTQTGVNNNLIFNNMCWKIVRTTETGGVKLIYNGTPSNGKCETQTGDSTQIGTSAFNSNVNDNAYVGYMYGTVPSTSYTEAHTNTNDSTIKQYIDAWYKTNFVDSNSDQAAKLEDTVFCNDRSLDTGYLTETAGYGTIETYYGSYSRSSYSASNPNPTLICTNLNDKFTVSSSNGNGKLTYSVGLITTDEARFAGLTNNQNSSNYLYTNIDYRTLTSVAFTYSKAVASHVNGAGNISYCTTDYVLGVRPAVSLASGVQVIGSGSTTDPYVVQ